MFATKQYASRENAVNFYACAETRSLPPFDSTLSLIGDVDDLINCVKFHFDLFKGIWTTDGLNFGIMHVVDSIYLPRWSELSDPITSFSVTTTVYELFQKQP